MNYNAAIRTLCLCLITAGVLCVCWVTMRQEQTIGDAATALTKALPDLSGTVGRVNATLDAVNAPCIGFHGSVTCGPIAQLSQTEKNVGIVAGQSALQVKQSGELIDAAAISIEDVTKHVDTVADTATTTLASVSILTSEVGSKVPPLLEAYTQTGDDLDATIKDNAPSLHLILVHGAGMSASGDLMLSDAQWKTHQLLHPDKVKLGFWGGADATALWIHSRILPPIF